MTSNCQAQNLPMQQPLLVKLLHEVILLRNRTGINVDETVVFGPRFNVNHSRFIRSCISSVGNLCMFAHSMLNDTCKKAIVHF